MMQLGFTMLEVGSVRKKNISSILVKNMAGACVSAIAYWFIGYAMAFGPGPAGSDDSSNIFAGVSGSWGFFLTSVERSDYGDWFLQWVFAASSTSIVSGAVAERCRVDAYLIYTATMSSIVYPIVSCWIWGEKGFLNFRNPNAVFGGVIDAAGCGPVHLCGGLAALIGCYFLGPRQGRYIEYKLVAFGVNSQVQRVIGVFLLWFGWYSFNTVSAGDLDSLPAKNVAITTTLSAASCGIVSMLIHSYLLHDHAKYSREARWDIDCIVNGILAGLVSITSACATVESWAAVVIGAFSSLVWMGCKHLVMKREIDDVVDAVAIHAGCGMWGLLAPAFFAKPLLIANAYPLISLENIELSAGVFYGGNGRQLLASLLALLTITTWSLLLFVPLFYALAHYNVLRVEGKEEERECFDDVSLSHVHHGDYMKTSSCEIIVDSSSHNLDPHFIEQWVKLKNENNNQIRSIDKSMLLAISFSRNTSNVMTVLEVFDRISGGDTYVSGPQYESFIAELRNTYQPLLSASRPNKNKNNPMSRIISNQDPLSSVSSLSESELV